MNYCNLIVKILESPYENYLENKTSIVQVFVKFSPVKKGKGNDILNQNINARREVVGNVITDYRTTIISRYFLLKVTLRFNNRKTKEEDFNGWH